MTDPTLRPEPPTAAYVIEVLATPRVSSPSERVFLEVEPPHGFALCGWQPFSESISDNGGSYADGRIALLWRHVDHETESG